MDTDLSKKMLNRADKDGLQKDHELRIKAISFDAATKDFYSNPQTCDVKKFLGCWAQARKAWCAYTGEALI